VGSETVLDAVVKRKIPSPHRESNSRTPIFQPVAQRYTTELSWLLLRFVSGRRHCLTSIVDDACSIKSRELTIADQNWSSRIPAVK
jgi:hypothetical protein